jgi:hypothetical protein
MLSEKLVSAVPLLAMEGNREQVSLRGGLLFGQNTGDST